MAGKKNVPKSETPRGNLWDKMKKTLEDTQKPAAKKKRKEANQKGHDRSRNR
jgi:hypothetical protein